MESVPLRIAAIPLPQGLVGEGAADNTLQQLIRLSEAEAQAVDIVEYLQKILLIVELSDERGEFAELVEGRDEAVTSAITSRGGGREGKRCRPPVAVD